MNIRQRYINTIKGNCSSPENVIKDVSYWRNNLFAGLIIALLPLCVIALIPGVYWSFHTKQYLIAYTDIAVLISIVAIAFLPGIALHIRKILFLASLYTLSCIMVFTSGTFGSGELYLFFACLVGIVIFPTKYSLWPAIFNTLICVLVGIGIYYKMLPWAHDIKHSLGTWIATSSSLVFLGFLSSLLIPRLFKGLEETLDNEKETAHQLSLKHASLTKTMALLEKKSVEMEQFSYAASHDLQEPLRMVTCFLGLLEKKYENIIDEKGKQYFSFAMDGAKRMKQLIIDLLEFSQVGRLSAIMENINLNGLIDDIWLLYRNEAEKKNAKIVVETLPVVLGNKIALNQVFQNLISNGLKYSRDAGENIITIGAVEKEFHWQFSVSDNGIGISKENFEKVFIIFKRLHSKEQYPGTGIGLALTKKNVEQMGGEIWLESEVDKGSTFYFTIAKHFD